MSGRARLRAIRSLCPPRRPLVDVGADHGHLAAALGGIATERQPHRMGRRDVRWVVADGLKPFRDLPVAVVAGMGARRIAQILAEGGRPEVAVVHAADDPPLLRHLLAEAGWRIDAEALAPEAGRFAEVIRVRRGHEEARGLWLALGPRLLQGDDPHLVDHLRQLHAHWSRIAADTRDKAPLVHTEAASRLRFLADRLAERGQTVTKR